jgi:Tol biopolymer transport system component
MGPKTKIALAVGTSIIAVIVIIATIQIGGLSKKENVPHEGAWGIYSLVIESKKVDLVYSSENALQDLSLNGAGDRLAFSERIGGTSDSFEEICSINVDGTGFAQLTKNSVLDTYPAWSSDGSVLYFLSWRTTTLDIYSMNPDGSGQVMFYDSGYHDADVNSVGDKLVFTRQSQIWSINNDASGETRTTGPPRAGEWGDANLPFGDYDPRLNPDGGKIVFERLVDDTSVHGNYDLYVVNADGTGEHALTANGYSQGLASWSHSGDRIAYIVAAINDTGVYRIYMMKSDGTSNMDVTPSYFPDEFLCHSVVFSQDDSRLFFIGQWW